MRKCPVVLGDVMKTPRKTLLSSSSPSNPTSGRWPWIPIKEAFPHLLAFVAVVAIVVFFLRWHIKSSYEEEVLFWQARLTGVADDQAQRVSRSEEHTSELQSRQYLVCRLLLE